MIDTSCSTENLYTSLEVRQIFNSYVQAKQLVNANDQQYINIAEDDALLRAVYSKGRNTPDFMKRDDAMKKIEQNMQRWFEMKTEGNEPVRK